MIAGLFMLFISPVTGKYLQPKFELIDARKGLSSSHIICILQDKKGFMWLGTINGLVKYDGYNWTIYRQELLHPKIPHTQVVVSLYEDDQDYLWLGARNSLTRFDRSNEVFKHYQVEVPNAKLASFSQITRILADPNNKNILWLQVLNKVAKFEKSSGRVTFYGVPGDTSKLREIQAIFQLQMDGKGNLLLVNRQGMIKYDPVNDTIIPFRKKEFVSPPPGFPLSISPSTHDRDIFWIGYSSAFERLNIETGSSTIFRLPLKDSHPAIINILESQIDKNKIMLGTWQSGLIEFRLKSRGFSNYKHEAGNAQSLSSNTIYSMFQERNGTLWIGTGSGLNRLEVRNNLIETIGAKHTDQKGLSNKLVYWISQSLQQPDQFWIGTADGLNRYNRAKNTFQDYKFGVSGPLGPNHITGVVESSHEPNVLWLATLGGGLHKFDRIKETHVSFVPDSNNDKSINSRFLLSLHESNTEHSGLWIGTLDKGVNFLNYQTGEFDKYNHSETDKNTISFGPVSSIHESNSLPGTLWFGTIGGGFCRLDTKTGTFKRFENSPDDPSSLSSDMISCFFESSQQPGILWIGTTYGVNCLDMKKGVFLDFPGKDSLKKYFINGFVEDKEGYKWLTTFQGLLRYNPKDGSILHLDARDGFSSNEMSAIWKSDEGEVFVGSMNGIDIFQPSKIHRNTVEPPIVITGLRIGNQPVKTGWVMKTSSVTLSHRDRVFSFYYAALNFYNADKNQYAYKMEGFDKDWHHAGNSRMAIFTGLRPGEYTFRVKGSNNDNVWNNTGASIKVIIKPPWWKTTWAYILFGMALVLLIFSLNRTQRRRLIRKERDQARITEANLRARAAEAQAKAMEIENRRKTEELEKARRLQLSMLPHQVPDLPGKTIGVFMRTAAEVGGDYYDFLTSPNGDLTIVFGDATGHGLNAGTMVSIIKGIMMSSPQIMDLSALFATCTDTIKRMKLGNLFMGLSLLQQRPDNWRFISAGMPPIHIYKKNSGTVETVLQKTPPLGAFADYTYTDQAIELELGDTVLLFSDGLPELFDETGEMFGFNSVRDCFKKAAADGLSPDEIIDSLRDAGEKWRKEGSQDDDITFVVLKLSKT